MVNLSRSTLVLLHYVPDHNLLGTLSLTLSNVVVGLVLTVNLDVSPGLVSPLAKSREPLADPKTGYVGLGKGTHASAVNLGIFVSGLDAVDLQKTLWFRVPVIVWNLRSESYFNLQPCNIVNSYFFAA